MDMKREIAARLKAARTTTGMTLAKLATATGGKLTTTRIGNYETGTRLPGPQEILILAEALGADAAYLMCLDGGGMTKEEQQLLADYRALPERDRKEYSRRLSALALVYRDPVPDERLTGWNAGKKLPARKPAK